jgi:hypothetical protein
MVMPPGLSVTQKRTASAIEVKTFKTLSWIKMVRHTEKH